MQRFLDKVVLIYPARAVGNRSRYPPIRMSAEGAR